MQPDDWENQTVPTVTDILLVLCGRHFSISVRFGFSVKTAVFGSVRFSENNRGSVRFGSVFSDVSCHTWATNSGQFKIISASWLVVNNDENLTFLPRFLAKIWRLLGSFSLVFEPFLDVDAPRLDTSLPSIILSSKMRCNTLSDVAVFVVFFGFWQNRGNFGKPSWRFWNFAAVRFGSVFSKPKPNRFSVFRTALYDSHWAGQISSNELLENARHVIHVFD
jgi:hypothetical protein